MNFCWFFVEPFSLIKISFKKGKENDQTAIFQCTTHCTMKSHGFRFVVLLVCTAYHGVLLLLLSSNLHPPECTNKLSSKSKGRDLSRRFVDISRLNTSIDNYPTHNDDRSEAEFRSSIEAAFQGNESNSSLIVDNGAWLVFCVIR